MKVCVPGYISLLKTAFLTFLRVPREELALLGLKALSALGLRGMVIPYTCQWVRIRRADMELAQPCSPTADCISARV